MKCFKFSFETEHERCLKIMRKQPKFENTEFPKPCDFTSTKNDNDNGNTFWN